MATSVALETVAHDGPPTISAEHLGDASVEQQAALDAQADETSASFLGQWQRLISTTNWEKGRIICEWRQALVESGATWQQYSDEAWSRRAGNVTGQHVGRLRRVFERFHAAHATYEGLYWSHFQAALDWPDAEMWLEGAVQNAWSISQMRHERWQAMGGADAERPRDEDVVDSELDEDFTPLADGEMSEVHATEASGGPVHFSGEENPDSAPGDGEPAGMDAAVPFDVDGDSAPGERLEPVRPFERLADLPSDVSEAFEAYKLAILHHKLAGWQDISCADLIGSLEALKQLALAPSAN